MKPHWVVVLGVVLAAAAGAAEPVEPLGGAAWPLETLVLVDGRTLHGLVVDGEHGIDFVQVVRPPGRPMYLISWGAIPGERIASLERLSDEEHRRLVGRVDDYRAERQRGRDAATEVRLDRDADDVAWRCSGAHFLLESTADAAITRQAVIRLEQVLGGLTTLVPPRGGDPPRFQVRLCGTAAEYHQVQRELGVSLVHPAFYVPDRRLLVAGSDLPAVVAQRQAADESLAAAAQRYAELGRTLDERLKELAADLEGQGVDAATRAGIVQRARVRWTRERAAGLASLATARRENAARAERAERAFYGRLAHEAWHAYAHLWLGGGLPPWLDEGLAQVVETAPVEAGELRFDAAEPRRLARLQESIRDGTVPPLADFVVAGHERFRADHAAELDASGLNYLVAWGLAFDLAVGSPRLTADRLAATGADDAADFALLVGSTPERFEPGWRERILALRPRAVTPAR